MIKRSLKKFSILGLMLFTSCDPSVKQFVQGAMPQADSTKVTIVMPAVNLSANQTLLVSYKSSLGTFTHNRTPFVDTGAGLPHTIVALDITIAGVAKAGAGVATDTSQILAPTATVPPLTKAPSLDVTFTVTPSSSLLGWACSFVSPALTANCLSSGFHLSSAQLSLASSVATNWNLSSKPEISVTSNSLSVSRIVVREVSNTANDPNLDDGFNSFYVWNGDLYFSASGSPSAGLFKLSDSTSTISQIAQRFLYSDPDAIEGVFNNKLLFWAGNSSGVFKLYAYDGASSVTQETNTYGWNGASDLNSPTPLPQVIGTKFYYVCYDSSNHICSYDGTATKRETRRTVFGAQDVSVSSPMLLKYANTLIFATQDSGGGTPYLAQFDPAGGTFKKISSFQIYMAMFGTQAFLGPVNGFYYVIDSVSQNLYKTTDFTSYQRVSLTNGAADNVFFANVSTFSKLTSSHNNWLYFNATNASGKYKCYRTDGTNVVQVLNNLGNATDEFCSMISLGGSAYIIAKNATGGQKLFKYDGTTLQQISNTIENQSADDSPSILGYYNNEVYFSAKNKAGFSKLYKYDGTQVVQLTDIFAGDNDYPSNLNMVGSNLYFKAQKSTFVYKLFRICDKANATCPD